MVSDGFRKNKTLKTKTTFLKTIAMSKGLGWKPILSVTGSKSPDNDSSKKSWLEASTKTHCSSLTTHCSVWYWLPASGEEHDLNP